MKNLAVLLSAAVLLLATTASAQTAKPVELGDLEIRREALPGSKVNWIKLIVSYSTTEKWMDGIAFNFEALVRSPDGSTPLSRLLTGSITYVNVPAGRHIAIAYLSPGATARFGAPVAVRVQGTKGDEVIGEVLWPSGTNEAEFANPKVRRLEGFLSNVRSTPWVVVDSDKTPDVFAPY